MKYYFQDLKSGKYKGNKDDHDENWKKIKKIRCTFCRGIGHYAKDYCPSKSLMWNLIRNDAGAVAELKEINDSKKPYTYSNTKVGQKMLTDVILIRRQEILDNDLEHTE